MASLALIIASNTVPIILVTKLRYQSITGILDQVDSLISINLTDIILIDMFKEASMYWYLKYIKGFIFLSRIL